MEDGLQKKWRGPNKNEENLTKSSRLARKLIFGMQPNFDPTRKTT